MEEERSECMCQKRHKRCREKKKEKAQEKDETDWISKKMKSIKWSMGWAAVHSEEKLRQISQEEWENGQRESGQFYIYSKVLILVS